MEKDNEKELINKVIQEMKRQEKEELQIRQKKKEKSEEQERCFWFTMAIMCLMVALLFVVLNYLCSDAKTFAEFLNRGRSSRSPYFSFPY